MKSSYSTSFEEMIAPFEPDLCRYCKRLAGSNWDGEDLFQETMIKAYRRYQRWPERELSKPYLYRIATNCWIDICRREKLNINPEILDEGSAVNYSEWSRYDVRESLEWLMDSLEPRQVVLILLIDVFGFTPTEASTAIGQPVTAIKAALHRARTRLKKIADRKLLNYQNEASVTQAHQEEADLQLFEAFVTAFKQADMDSMFQAYRDLTAAGLRVDRVARSGNRLYFYFKDPDGNPLMITSRSKKEEAK